MEYIVWNDDDWPLAKKQSKKEAAESKKFEALARKAEAKAQAEHELNEIEDKMKLKTRKNK